MSAPSKKATKAAIIKRPAKPKEVFIEVPYNRHTFDMYPRQKGKPKVGDACFIHELKPGSTIQVSGGTSMLLDLWPSSALISTFKKATVPGKRKGDPRREVRSATTMHISRNTEVVLVELPPEGWVREEVTKHEPNEESEVQDGGGEAALEGAVPVGKRDKKGVEPADRKARPGRQGVQAEKGAVQRVGNKAERPAGAGVDLLEECEHILEEYGETPYKDVVKMLDKWRPGHGKNHKWVANVAFKMRKAGRL